MESQLKILFAEDLVIDFELAMHEIARASIKTESLRVDTREDFETALTSFKPRIIISDYIMPRFNGMLALEIKKEMCPDIPFIMLTGSMNEEIAVACMKAGADDYVIKEHIRRLPHAIEHALENARVRNDKRKAEKDLVKNELLLRTALNSLPASFVIYNSDRKIEYVNDYFLSTFNLTKAQVLGKLEEELFLPEITDKYLPMLQETFQLRQARSLEFLLNLKTDTRFLIMHFIPIVFETDQIDKVLGISFDITNQKNQEKEIREARTKAEESDRLKSAFLANVSHEIRTPLNAILGFTQMIKRSDMLQEPHSGYLDIVLESGSLLLEIIRQMLEISQLQAGSSNLNLAEFSLNDLCKEIFYLFEENHREKLNKDIVFYYPAPGQEKSDLVIFSDREKLYRILHNLISNAFKFTKEGEINFGWQQKTDNQIDFYVRDTGIGIEPDKLKIVFEAFRQVDDSFTRKYGGVGLGLAIARSLVRILGGEIFAESTPGHGSVFRFSISQTLKVLQE